MNKYFIYFFIILTMPIFIVFLFIKILLTLIFLLINLIYYLIVIIVLLIRWKIEKKNIKYETYLWDPVTNNLFLMYIWLFFYLTPRVLVYKLIKLFSSLHEENNFNFFLKYLFIYIIYYTWLYLTGIPIFLIQYVLDYKDLNFEVFKFKTLKKLRLLNFLRKYWIKEMDKYINDSKLLITLDDKIKIETFRK